MAKKKSFEVDPNPFNIHLFNYVLIIYHVLNIVLDIEMEQ